MKKYFSTVLLCSFLVLLILVGCKKKSTEITTESLWSGSMEVEGSPLTNTLTIYSDKSFTLDTTVTLFGVGMDFNKVGLGSIQGDSTEEGEIILTLEELAPDIIPILESVGAVAIPLPVQVSATIQEGTITIQDIGLGQEISLQQQSIQ